MALDPAKSAQEKANAGKHSLLCRGLSLSSMDANGSVISARTRDCSLNGYLL